MNKLTKEEKIGQLIIAGFDGCEFNDHLKTIIEKYKVANFIIFSRNISTIDKLIDLIRKIYDEVKKHCHTIPFISIDQEGGMVTRIQSGATFFPGNMSISATNNPNNAYLVGKMMGEELTHLGINLNLAPSLDVNNNPNNPVIGVRSYSDNPNRVALFGNEYIKGLQEAGVIATAKHFPGHGDTNVDSHLGLPVIKHDRKRLLEVELVPFKEAIKKGVKAIMSAHIVFEKITQEHVPGTLSKEILTDLLRKECGFEGMIVSDCMQMKAIDDEFTTQKGVVMGIKAGLDMACVSHSLEKQVLSIELLNKAIENEEITISEIDEKVERILKYKEETIDIMEKNFLSKTNSELLNYFHNNNHQELAQEIIDDSLTMIKGKKFIPMKKVLVVAAIPFAATIAEDKLDTRNIVDMVKRNFPTYDAIKLDLKTDNYDHILGVVKNYDQVVVCSYNANNYPNQVKLINDIYKANHELYVLSTRNPYDYLELTEIPNLASLYEYTPISVKTIMKYLKGEINYNGKCPIACAK